MCLTIDKSIRKRIKIAKEDIPIWKALRVKLNFNERTIKLESPLFNKLWVLNKTYTVKEIEIRKRIFTNEYHKGLHAYSDIKIASNTSHQYLFQGIIPKGAEYIEHDGRIVATKMKLIKVFRQP